MLQVCGRKLRHVSLPFRVGDRRARPIAHRPRRQAHALHLLPVQIKHSAVINIVGRPQHHAQRVRRKIEMRPKINRVRETCGWWKFRPQGIRIRERPRVFVPQQAPSLQPARIIVPSRLELSAQVDAGIIISPNPADGDQGDLLLPENRQTERARQKHQGCSNRQGTHP